MRQLVDLMVWVGMIGLAVGVIHYTPIVAEYVTAERKPQMAPAVPVARMHPVLHRSPHAPGEWRDGR